MPKMQQNTFGGLTQPGLARRAYALPQPKSPSCNGGLLPRGTEREGKRIPPKVKVTRINTAQ